MLLKWHDPRFSSGVCSLPPQNANPDPIARQAHMHRHRPGAQCRIAIYACWRCSPLDLPSCIRPAHSSCLLTSSAILSKPYSRSRGPVKDHPLNGTLMPQKAIRHAPLCCTTELDHSDSIRGNPSASGARHCVLLRPMLTKTVKAMVLW